MNHTGDITMYAYRSKSPIVEAGLRYQKALARQEQDRKRGIKAEIDAGLAKLREEHAAWVQDRRRRAIARFELALRHEPPPEDHRISVREIIEETAAKHGVSIVDIKSRRRARHLVLARHEAMWRARHETPHSYPLIGRWMGGRDHTTVIHGVNKHQSRIDSGEVV